MIQIETAVTAGPTSSAERNPLERSASFSSPTNSSDRSDGSVERPSIRLSPTKQGSFSAVVKVSKMQASFAERTATEMEEIVSWYKKYEGMERLKKENQQIQSMPHNAMIVVDDEDNDDNIKNNTVEKENVDTNQQDSEQQELQVGDEEFVTVKDYHTPTQKTRKKLATPMCSQKKATSLLAAAVRSITKARKTDDPPPLAINVSSEDEGEPEIPSLSPKRSADDSMKRVDQTSSCAVSIELVQENPNQGETSEYDDKEEEVLAMLSPTGCAQQKAQTIIENSDDYFDEEEEVLELLMSPSSSSGKSVLSLSGGRKSPVGSSDDSQSCTSTGQEAQNQIKAADDLIRNTQNMAEIISQLQQSSLAFCDENDGDNDNINGNGTNLDDTSHPTSSASLSSLHYELDTRSINEMSDRDVSCYSNASVASFKVRVPNSTKKSLRGFQRRLFYRAIVPIVLSLVIGSLLKYIKA